MTQTGQQHIQEMPNSDLIEDPKPAIRRIQLGQPIVDNVQSMARDQFATERNFLSWIKLSTGIAAAASTITKEFPNHTRAHTKTVQAAEIFFIALSMLIVILSTAYALENQRKLVVYSSPLRLFKPIFLLVLLLIAAISLAFVLALSYFSL